MNQNPNQRIFDVIQEIAAKRYRVPSIQRGYEWQPERVLKLFDSIMNGYPIGAIMVWRPSAEVFNDIPNRSFIEDFDSKRDYLSEPPHEASNAESYLVLDGQQRLQSLFLAFLGSYDRERVYMQVDYVAAEENGGFGFEFLAPEDAKKRPEMAHVAEIVALDSDTKFEFAEKRARILADLATDCKDREAVFNAKRAVIARNADRFIERFNVKTALLLQEVEQRQTYDHVLEIFERVNSGGMVLSKSDLLFSTIKLKLHQMEGKFAATLEFLNQGERHKFDTDFLIKAALVIFNQRARYEVKKLKDDNFVHALEARYDELHTCLRQLLAWLDDVALIKCDRFLRSQLALVPILDYMMASGKTDKPDGANGQAMRQYLYMSSFLRTYSRSADAVLDSLHDKISEAVRGDRAKFPIANLREFIANRAATAFDVGDHHLNDDADLALNIVDRGVLQIDPNDPKRSSKDLKLEVDHIFPRTPLSRMGMEDVVNHVGNYRLVVMPINRRKLAKMPDLDTAFFGRTDADVEAAYRKALEEMSRENFLAFRDARAALIKRTVREFLALGEAAPSMDRLREPVVPVRRDENVSPPAPRAANVRAPAHRERQVAAADLMRIVPCGDSLHLNTKFDLYYQPSARSYRPHSFIGLYSGRRVQYIMEIDSVFDVSLAGGTLTKTLVQGRETAEHDEKISKMIDEAKSIGHPIAEGHRFFCAKQALPTNFVKASRGPVRNAVYLNLREKLGEVATAEVVARRLSETQF